LVHTSHSKIKTICQKVHYNLLPQNSNIEAAKSQAIKAIDEVERKSILHVHVLGNCTARNKSIASDLVTRAVLCAATS